MKVFLFGVVDLENFRGLFHMSFFREYSQVFVSVVFATNCTFFDLYLRAHRFHLSTCSPGDNRISVSYTKRFIINKQNTIVVRQLYKKQYTTYKPKPHNSQFTQFYNLLFTIHNYCLKLTCNKKQNKQRTVSKKKKTKTKQTETDNRKQSEQNNDDKNSIK